MEEKLISQYKEYSGSEFFIKSAFKAMSFRKEKDVSHFITNFFLNNRISVCDYQTVKKLAAHWNNIAFDKLNMKDYPNYIYSLLTVANLRMTAKEMEGE